MGVHHNCWRQRKPHVRIKLEGWHALQKRRPRPRVQRKFLPRRDTAPDSRASKASAVRTRNSRNGTMCQRWGWSSVVVVGGRVVELWYVVVLAGSGDGGGG
eukprot:5598239-Pleurochrysis_carterae.AAC.1